MSTIPKTIRSYKRVVGPFFIYADDALSTPHVWVTYESGDGKITVKIPPEVACAISEASRDTYPDAYCCRCHMRPKDGGALCFMCEELDGELRNEEQDMLAAEGADHDDQG